MQDKCSSRFPNSHLKEHAVFMGTPAARMGSAGTKQVSPGELTSPHLKPELQWLPISYISPFGTTGAKETWVS